MCIFTSIRECFSSWRNMPFEFFILGNLICVDITCEEYDMILLSTYLSIEYSKLLVDQIMHLPVHWRRISQEGIATIAIDCTTARINDIQEEDYCKEGN